MTQFSGLLTLTHRADTMAAVLTLKRVRLFFRALLADRRALVDEVRVPVSSMVKFSSP